MQASCLESNKSGMMTFTVPLNTCSCWACMITFHTDLISSFTYFFASAYLENNVEFSNTFFFLEA